MKNTLRKQRRVLNLDSSKIIRRLPAFCMEGKNTERGKNVCEVFINCAKITLQQT